MMASTRFAFLCRRLRQEARLLILIAGLYLPMLAAAIPDEPTSNHAVSECPLPDCAGNELQTVSTTQVSLTLEPRHP